MPAPRAGSPGLPKKLGRACAGAIFRNLPYDQVTDPQTRRLRDADELSELFRDAGVALDRPVVTSCGSGVTACALAFALHLIGHPGAAVYDGSWSEWGLPGDTPVETGPPPANMPPAKTP